MRFALLDSHVPSRSRRPSAPARPRRLPTAKTPAPALALALGLALSLAGLTGCAPTQDSNVPPTARAVSREELEAMPTVADQARTAADTAQPIAGEQPSEGKKGWMPRLWPFGGKKEKLDEPDTAVESTEVASNAPDAPAPEEKEPGLLRRAVGALPFVGSGDESGIKPPPRLPDIETNRAVLPKVPKNQRVRARAKELRGLEMLVTLDPESPRASLDRRIGVGIILYNSGKDSVSLRFGSTQTREILIRGANGAVITRWSEDYVFERALTSLVINPGERVVYNETISTRDLSTGQQYLLDVGVQGYSELQVSLPLKVRP